MLYASSAYVLELNLDVIWFLLSTAIVTVTEFMGQFLKEHYLKFGNTFL